VRALTYTAPRTLEWREAPDPVLDSDHAALVRPVAVATCDLDALIIAGESPFPPPFAIGHECVAEVTALGDAVSSLELGQLVSVPFQISCGECANCRRARSGNCTAVDFMSTYGFGPAVKRWGGFLADEVRVPYARHMLVALPVGLAPAALASASDNIPDAWRAVGPALAEEPGAQVLVVGGASSGSIGLYAVALARTLGAAVVYVDADQGRRRTAQALGAEVLERAPKRLGPFPVTVDSSADAEGLRLALRSTAPDGVCTSTAIYFGEQPSLPLLEMYTKGITFRTGRVHAREAIPRVLELAASGAFEPQRITTRVIGWDDAEAALAECDWTKLVIERPPLAGGDHPRP
jgi:threonine dehydrogenase-like Zn-dependent dehydrogenase